jgi:ClpP class serine protease
MSLYEWAQSVPWQIMPDALALMLELAQRAEVDADSLKQAMHGPKSLALRDGRPREDSRDIVMHGPVARIAIDGPIFRYADFFTRYSGGITTEALAKNFQIAMDDPAVGAILFVIDSPGGEATGINELADAIYASRSIKPSAAYVEGFGASAALRIGLATGLVVVDEDAWLGSIGTVFGVTDPSKQLNKRTIDFVSSQSPKKRADPTTPEGAAYYQQMVDDMTETFIAKVMRDRGMTRDQVLSLGGGMVVGAQAVAAGLADRLGSEDQLIRELMGQSIGRMVFAVPPARVPSGNPLRMEESMQLFSKEWWSNLFAAQAEVEGTPLAAVVGGTRTVQMSTEQLARIEAAHGSQIGGTPAPDPRTAELEAEIATLRKQQIGRDAVTFADTLITIDHKALPAERAQLISLYTQAAQDDAAHPLTGSRRVALLEQAVQARPAHQLIKELVPDQKLVALTGATPAEGVQGDYSAERAQATEYAKRANGKAKTKR